MTIVEKKQLTLAIEVLGRTRHNWWRMGVLCKQDIEFVQHMLTDIQNGQDILNFKHKGQTDVDQMRGDA